MKVAALLAGIAVLACGCDRKSQTADSPPRVEAEKSAQASPARLPEEKVAATREQIGSTVGVRVIAGGLPVINVTGAVLHREELPPDEPFFDQHRCVAAYLKGWTEAQLKSDQAQIVIFRNLPNQNGQMGCHAYPGKFLQFDEKTGIALFTYHQGFSADTDLGFKIARETNAPRKAVALRYGDTANLHGPTSSTTQQSHQLWQPPVTVDEGHMDLATAASGKLALPAAPGADAVLIATGSASLVGFASNSGADGTNLVRPASFQISFKGPTVTPTNPTFTNSGGSVQMSLGLDRKNGAEDLNRVWILKSAVPGGTKVDLNSYAEPFRALPVAAGQEPTHAPVRADQTVAVHLNAPQSANEETSYLVQVGWAPSISDQKPTSYSRPFLVKIARNSVGINATTEGIGGTSAPSAEKDAQTATFEMEAPVVRVFEIAEGREVLMQLNGAPYWKRFSMEKKTWLPLPPMNPATADLAGNRSSLIVLDRAAREVKRYQLTDLSEAADAKIDLPGEELFTVRAGCLSDQAPIHVFSNRGPISLDPETLERIDDSDERYDNRFHAEGASKLSASGDGIAIFSGYERNVLSFRGNIVGLRNGYFDVGSPNFSKGAMVSAAYTLEERQVSSCAASGGEWQPVMVPPTINVGRRLSAFPNVPVVARVSGGDTQPIPPVPPQLELFSLWHAEPLVALPVPELASLSRSYGSSEEPKHHICVDWRSRRIGILSPDQKSWSVREFGAPRDNGLPLLTNWPETSVKRGGEFHFVPQHLGEARYIAEVIGTRQHTPVTVDEKGISFRIAEQELASLVVLKLTLTGSSGSTVVSIPIHVRGVPPPFIWAGENLSGNPDDFGNGFRSLMAAKEQRIPLKTYSYESPDRILEILSPTNDILAFVTSANRVDLFSQSARRIVGNVAATPTAKYYAGNDALFEFDSNTRNLTRITVPDGQRVAQFNIPAGMALNAIALGSQRTDPISLFVSRPYDQYAPPANPQAQALSKEWSFATWDKGDGLALLNGETLQPAGVAQPSIWRESIEQEMGRGPIAFWRGGDRPPMKIAGSQNGSVLHLNKYFGVFLPRFAIVAPYPETLQQRPEMYQSNGNAEGSITGMVVTGEGKASFNGVIQEDLGTEAGTPCGRYVLAKTQTPAIQTAGFEVRSLDNRKPIFRVNRLAALKADRETGNSVDLSGIQMIRENGPAIVRSRGNKLLQFLECNIAQLSLQAAPENLHVVSQPHPFVMEGGIYEYQLKVNNPALVKSLRLRNPPPNTTLSATSLLRLAAPQNVRLTERVPVSIEIETKVGENVLHNFSVIAITKKAPTAPPPTSRQPGGATRRGNARTL